MNKSTEMKNKKMLYNVSFWAFVTVTAFAYVWTFFSIIYLIFWDLI